MLSRASPSTADTAGTAVAEAERLLRQGEPLLAYNIADSGLQRWPESLRLRQLLALSLARGGDLERANRILGELAASGLEDTETLGVLARTHKDLGMRATDTDGRWVHLEAAYRLYAQAFSASRRLGDVAGATYAGINAATVAVLRGEVEEARWIAADVQEICKTAAGGDAGSEAEYWRYATLGEAALILGDAPAAASRYATAVSLAQGRFGDLSTTRRQARLLAARLWIDDEWLAQVLPIPPVLVFTGNMVDPAGRPTPRFPADLEPRVRMTIRESLAITRPLAAYGSAASGADILCLELMQELGGETHIVLPFPAAEFRRTSVETAPGDWGRRFDRLLDTAASVTITSDHRASGSVATYEYANLVLTGLGQLRAQLLDTSVLGLVVWDPQAGAGPGGSASVVAVWQERGIPIQQVHLCEGRSGALADVPRIEEAPAAAPTRWRVPRHDIKALLFADAVGYSQLSEDQIPHYVTGFLGAVADLNRHTGHRCEHVETAGDSLYMVFGDAHDAAHYALELCRLVNGTDWVACGLTPTFSLRIALHCGPVYCGWDPVTGSRLITGPHASRAARIEPITPPGQVYASSAFAAVATARGVEGICLSYVGTLPLAKRSGSMALYHVQSA